MAEYIDISLTLSPELPLWPGSSALEVRRRRNMNRGDTCNESEISGNLHTGTHVDAPLHFLSDGADVTALDLNILIGPVVVALLSEVDAITSDDLEGLELPTNVQRLLLRTRNSDEWLRVKREFRRDFVALTADAAHWIVARGIKLIGIDYLSVQRFEDGPEIHLALLQAGVVILEGLNLSQAAAGNYDLICLPLKLANAEGSPARAVLRPLA